MKKALLIAAVAASASIPSFANDTYFALELFGGQYDFSGKNKEGAKDFDDMGGFALKVGHYLNQNVRAYGYAQIAVSDEINNVGFYQREIGAGADYLHYVNDKFYLLAGGNLGYQKTTFENDGANPFKVDNSGISAGANLGLGYKFTDNFGMELGYRYNHYFSNEIKEANVNVDGSNVAYLNANFAF